MNCLILFAIALIACVAAQGQADIPPFLIGAPDQIVRQFFDIIKADETKTDPQTEYDIESFITRLGGDYKTRFDQFKQQMQAEKARYDQIHQAAIARFSPQARDADARMSALAADPNLTNQQKTQQIQAIMGSLSDAVRQEIQNAFNTK